MMIIDLKKRNLQSNSINLKANKNGLKTVRLPYSAINRFVGQYDEYEDEMIYLVPILWSNDAETF